MGVVIAQRPSCSQYSRALSDLRKGQDVVFKVVRHDENRGPLTVFLAGKVPA
jgi:hypothetical protein